MKRCLFANFLFALCFLFQLQPVSSETELSHVNVNLAIEKVYPALVKIQTISSYYDSGRERKMESSGSGVIISPDGYVVTNHHVAGRAGSIQCVLSSREELDAKLIGTDPLTDIAVIQLDLSKRQKTAGPLPFAKWGSSDSVRIGDTVLAMGSPLAISQSVTQGIVANKDMLLPAYAGSFMLEGEDVGLLVKWIGHDAQILPGNSGGPLVDLSGHIIGINEVNLGGGSLGGAIPAELAKSVAGELISKGSVTRTWIGIEFQPLLQSYTSQQPDASGVLVSGIVSGGVADRVGIRAGDILLSIDETVVSVKFREELSALHQMLFSQPPGKTLRLKFLRGTTQFQKEVKTQIRPETLDKDREIKEWGIVVENLTVMSAKERKRPNENGVLVTSVKQGGPAGQASPALQAEDVIVELDRKPVADKEAFLVLSEKLTAGHDTTVPLLVAFDRRQQRLLTVVEVGFNSPVRPVPEVRKAWLGVATQVLTRKLAEALGIAAQKGIRITDVYEDSSAAKAGLKTGDILTHIDDQPIEASETQDLEVFPTMLRQYATGSLVKIKLLRDGKPLTLNATLEIQPKPVREMKTYENVDLEFHSRDITYSDRIDQRLVETDAGALVTEVQPAGWASVGRLQVGDLVQQVNGKKIESVNDLSMALDQAKEQKDEYIVMLVKRGIHTVFLEIQPVWPDMGQTNISKGKNK